MSTNTCIVLGLFHMIVTIFYLTYDELAGDNNTDVFRDDNFHVGNFSLLCVFDEILEK